MKASDAIWIIEQNAPCEHADIDQSLGVGGIWVKCLDCDTTIHAKGLEAMQGMHDEFVRACEVVRSVIGENGDDWHGPSDGLPVGGTFVWVYRDSISETELAFFDGDRFQRAHTAGDREGLSVEYLKDVTHWADLNPPVFTQKYFKG